MSRDQLILVGGGGHCRACIDVIEMEGKYDIAGIIDIREKLGQEILGYKVIATDENLPELVGQYKYFLVTLGQITDSSRRHELFDQLRALKVRLPVIVSPLAYVSKHAQIGEGTIIMHQAVINAGARMGNNCIINSKALIEHDVEVQDHCHIATASVTNGGSVIGHHSFVGSQSVIHQNCFVAPFSIIGAGAVVSASIKESGGIYVGNPARNLVKR